MNLTDDIARKVISEFGEDADEVVQDLLKMAAEDPQIFNDRLLRCIVFISHGSRTKMQEAYMLAKTDFRDVIVAAEYDANWVPVRDFRQPFPLETT